jgi:hypothetical protein
VAAHDRWWSAGAGQATQHGGGGATVSSVSGLKPAVVTTPPT